ncbi:hypothetical protein M3Y94_00133700 [Aphelenchoides besseyi]|nr:hypothetical protein M3Y94_00133700 [Aphelenchoides besseyi]
MRWPWLIISIYRMSWWKRVRRGKKSHGKSLPQVSSPFDWTYTSEYTGTLADGIRVEKTNDKIDIEKLKRPDPLLFYDAIQLYEDELADNGCAEMTVKVRAMPTNYFVLCRFYLRVDRVLVRVFDCRLYSEENWNYVLREWTKREAKYADIKTELHDLITDPAQIWQHLPVVEQNSSKLYYPAV